MDDADLPASDPQQVPAAGRLRQLAPRLLHWLVVLGGAVALGWAGWQIEDALLAQTNQVAAKHDQASNMRLATTAGEARAAASWSDGVTRALVDWLPSRTDGVINPLWPWVASFLDDAGKGESEEFFTAGKRWNARFTVIFLVGLAVFLGLRWSALAALNFTALVALAAFLPRAPYFQPEPLSYALTLLAWMLAVHLFSRNSLSSYAAFGLLTGLAWLAKSSAILLLAGFLLVSAWRWLVAVLGYRRQRGWSRRNAAVGSVLLLAVFVLTIAPRYHYAKERYGDGLFAYPAAWMWFDHFEPGYRWMNRHSRATQGDREPPPPPVAGPVQWLEQHGAKAFWNRLAGGTWQRLEEATAPKPTEWDDGQPAEPWRNLLDRRGLWLVGVGLGVAALAAWRAWLLRCGPAPLPDSARVPPPDASSVALFGVGTLGMMACSLGWYWPIAHFAERFTLILLALFAYLLFWAAEQLREHLPTVLRRRWLPLYMALQLLLSVLLVHRLVQLLGWPEFQ